jgi:hypothetical protein
MNYRSDSGQILPVHDHLSNQSCHWIPIFKPLSFIVLRDAQLMQGLTQSKYFSGRWRVNALDYSGYAAWLCGEDNDGMLNLLNTFLFVCEHRGLPSLPVIPDERSIELG